MDDTLPFKQVSDVCKWRTTTGYCDKLSDKPEICHRSICPEVKKAREIYEGPGVGMPAALLLDEFGSQIWSAFGTPAYLVGSALAGKKWRDVDVRLILSDEEYKAMGFGDPRDQHRNAKWVAYVLAFSALGKAMTGLPIDFQIQQQTQANKEHARPRSALGVVELRIKRDFTPET
jgi:hypothetical protein